MADETENSNPEVLTPLSAEELANLEASYMDSMEKYHGDGMQRLEDDIASDATQEQDAIAASKVVRVVVEKITPVCKVDDIAAARFVMQILSARLKELKSELDDRCLAWIEENGQDIVIGDTRLYAGHPKETKPRKGILSKLVERLLMKLGGDVDAFAEHFASKPLKITPCRDTLGDEFADFFEVVETTKLEEGVPKRKQLIESNEKFAKRRATAGGR